MEPSAAATDSGLWDWHQSSAANLIEVDEFRPHMPLHNFYEGHGASNGGCIASATLEAAEDRLRATLEACDRLRLVQCLVDMDSSWGGLAHEMLTYVGEECPGAVVAVVGNDWSYPLASDDQDAVFRVAADVRDRSKIEARKRINVASSIALLSEVSSLLAPIAMAPSSLPSTRFSKLRFDRSSCADVGAVAATALELALSTHQSRSAYELLDGLRPSMKVAELSASFPYTADPVMLLRRINDSMTNDIGVERASPSSGLFQNGSLLPQVDQVSSRETQVERPHKVHYRRLQFRGAFADCPSLRSLIESTSMSRRDITLQWSDAAPLTLPETYRIRALCDSSMDAVSQFALTSQTGDYLTALAQRVAKSDKRTLYEFTRAGMSPDAPEELEATLAGMGDALFPQ
ncbi:hypothetical protein BBJ28_00015392 [Nothophytophthora sp. Chile5]|nr:hypothetical protein BBJ28_00015392 [Nothophytophthora sp. Chile5]